jgi:hypothetical protein
MRHDVERYKMLLETETNPRVRRLLTGMIEELESRATVTVSAEIVTPTAMTCTEPTESVPHFFPL